MANYVSAQRSNYFRVTDNKAFENLMQHLSGEDELQLWAKEFNGVTHYAFGTYGTLSYYPHGFDEDSEPADWDEFEKELSKLLPDGEAVVIQEVGHENLRSLTGFASIITNRGIRGIDLTREAIRIAEELVGNPDYSTQLE